MAGLSLSSALSLSLAPRAGGVVAPVEVGGVVIGTEGGVGTPYAGLKFVEGDDFNSTPTRFSGRNPTGRYAALKLTGGSRAQATDTEFAMWVDPDWRGSRNQSPTALGLDGVSVSGGRAVLTGFIPDTPTRDVLPTIGYVGTAPDNKPRILSGALKTAPSFMLSAKADWAIEAKVRMQGGVVRGYWPSFWNTTMNNWPDYMELDLVEGKKDAVGAISSLMNIIGSTSDGAGASFVTAATRPFPVGRDVHSLATKIGNTIRFYDDIATEGTLALVATYTDARVARFRGAHQIHLDLAAGQAWDSSTYNAADWPATFEIDWWRAWVPVAAGSNPATTYLAAINTTPGGSWAATLPATATLSGGKAGLEEIAGWFDNTDAPGFLTRNTTTRIPGGMTVNAGTRAVTGTVPTTEGGRVFLAVSFAFDDGTPVAKALLPYNVAPAVQALFGNTSVAGGDAVSLSVGYTAFHSGNLGPHTYTATSDKGWLTVTGNGTGALTITGTAPADDVATVTVNCTNSIGQVTTVTRTVTAAAAPAFFFKDTFTASSGALTGRVSESGGTWATHPLTVGGAVHQLAGSGSIYQNALNEGVMTNTQAVPSANYFVEADLLVKTVISTALASVNGRMSSTAYTFYGIRYNGAAYVLYKALNGTLTNLVTYTFVQPTNVPATIRLEIEDDGLGGVVLTGYIDGVLRMGPYTDNTSPILDAGRIGTRIYGSNAGATTGQHFTEMRAGSL